MAKPKKSSRNNNNSSVKSTKSMADLEKDITRLKRQQKPTKAALVTTIAGGDESDLLDGERSKFQCGTDIGIGKVTKPT